MKFLWTLIGMLAFLCSVNVVLAKMADQDIPMTLVGGTLGLWVALILRVIFVRNARSEFGTGDRHESRRDSI